MQFRVRIFDDACYENSLETIDLELFDIVHTGLRPSSCGPDCFGLGQKLGAEETWSIMGVAATTITIIDEEDISQAEVVGLDIVNQPGQHGQSEQSTLNLQPSVRLQNACQENVDMDAGTVRATLMVREGNVCTLTNTEPRHEMQELQIIPLVRVATGADGVVYNDTEVISGASYILVGRDLSATGAKILDMGQHIMIGNSVDGSPKKLDGKFTARWEQLENKFVLFICSLLCLT